MRRGLGSFKRGRQSFVGFTVLLLAVGLVPAVAVAVGGTFTDDDTSVFEADIEWMALAGVTKGCNPPDNTRFCPEDEVTRGQMAAFMHRFARFLGAEDGVVSMADHAASADSATAAGDADTLDGLDSSAFVEHGTIVLRHGTMELTLEETFPSGSSGHIFHSPGGADVIGPGQVVFDLDGPAMIGGIGYDLASIEYCVSTPVDGRVTFVEVFGGSDVVGSDPTDRTWPGCYTVPVDGNGAHAYDIRMGFEGTGFVKVKGIQSTWAPTP